MVLFFLNILVGFFCRNDEFRKKASISFGIQFDKHKYGLLQKRLHEILIHKDRVSWFIEPLLIKPTVILSEDNLVPLFMAGYIHMMSKCEYKETERMQRFSIRLAKWQVSKLSNTRLGRHCRVI